jgi:glyoxylase-like metal-dependent hydrolase (beta-lactamase superfamily II)
MDIGDIQILPIYDGTLRIPPTTDHFDWFGGPGNRDADWATHSEFLDHDGNIILDIGAYLLRGGPLGERQVLVDTGFGPYEYELFKGGALLESLMAAGSSPGQITDVIYTHLHLDHLGWTRVNDASTFSNATHHCHQADLDWFTDPTNAGLSVKLAIKVVNMITDQLEPISGSGTLLPGIDIIDAPGHTPGSIVIAVSHRSERALLLGDIVHCPVQLEESEWGAISDVDPALARLTREAMVRELGDDLGFGAHFPGLRAGRLISAAGKKQWRPYS